MASVHFLSFPATSSQNEKLFWRILRKSKHIFYVQKLFFLENRAVYELMWKNIVSWAGHRWQHDVCIFHVRKL